MSSPLLILFNTHGYWRLTIDTYQINFDCILLLSSRTHYWTLIDYSISYWLRPIATWSNTNYRANYAPNYAQNYALWDETRATEKETKRKDFVFILASARVKTQNTAFPNAENNEVQLQQFDPKNYSSTERREHYAQLSVRSSCLKKLGRVFFLFRFVLFFLLWFIFPLRLYILICV